MGRFPSVLPIARTDAPGGREWGGEVTARRSSDASVGPSVVVIEFERWGIREEVEIVGERLALIPKLPCVDAYGPAGGPRAESYHILTGRE